MRNVSSQLRVTQRVPVCTGGSQEQDPCGSANRGGAAKREEEWLGSNMWAQRAESQQHKDDGEVRGTGSL